MSVERVVPVVVKVQDGDKVRAVRVGQAHITEGEVVLSLEPLELQLTPAVDTRQGAGNRVADLEWLAQRSRGILEDPRKARWHKDTRAQLALIEAEIERLRGKPAAPATH